MTGIEHLGLFIVAGLLLNLTPGPDVLYIVANGLRRGWRAGVVAALGITAGCFVHITAAAIGLSALVAASSTAFALLKWLGAAYLLYVGATLLLAKRGAGSQPDAPGLIAKTEDPVKAKGAKSLKDVFVQGFWTNALNPKVALFFLAFLPQFIAPGAPHKTQAFVLLGLLFNFNGLWVDIGWALSAAWLARRVAAVQRGMHWLQRTAGVMFIGFGVRLALSDNPVH
ncbi:MAG: LysE family translocator [Burkholderiaceae bacterium]|nr:MAG: LysE family translocator [Burkholderiaceae bacterium]